MSARSVLDANLERLLRRAYVPARPTPEFRARLEANFRAALVRHALAAPRAPRAPAPLSPPPLRRSAPGPTRLRPRLALGLAAGALLAAFLGWRLSTRPPAGLDEILARGEVALRSAPEGAWSSAGPPAPERALDLGGRSLELATPPGARALVRAGGGELRALGDARAALRPAGPGPSASAPLEARVERGAFELENGSDPWTLITPEGRLELVAARLDLTVADESVLLLLHRGRAALLDGARTALPAGREARLSAGALAASPSAALVTSADPASRAALAPEPLAPPSAGASVARPDASGAFAGRVIDADENPLPDFRVVLLKERVGYGYELPVVRRFEDPDGIFLWEELAFAAYDVYAGAGGFAFARVGRIEVEAGAPPAEIEARLGRGGEVSGFVVDARTGDPIEGAVVASQTNAPAHGLPLSAEMLASFGLPTSARTRPDGSFLLEHVASGEHELLILAAGHAPSWPTVAVSEGQRADLGSLELGQGGAVHGRVTDERGRGRPGVELVFTLLDAGSHALTLFALTETDPDGGYEVSDLPTGVLLGILLESTPASGSAWEPSGSGAVAPRVLPVVVEPGRSTQLDFLGQRSGARISGRLLDAGGRPVPYHKLALFDVGLLSTTQEWKASSTDQQGAFAFDDVRPGHYALLRVAEGSEWIGLVGELEVEQADVAGWEVRVPASVLRGRILDGQTGEPLPFAEVVLERVDPAGGAAIFAGQWGADEEGRFECAGLPAGSYLVVACTREEPAYGFERSPPLDLPASVGPGVASVEHDFRLFPGGRLHLRVRAEDGGALGFAGVQVTDPAGRPVSLDDFPALDERGEYTSHGLPPGTYGLRLERAGYLPFEGSFEVRSGHRAELEITLRAAADAAGARDE